jgi:hypothetical protein
MEGRLPVVSAHDDVAGNAGDEESGQARHEPINAGMSPQDDRTMELT